VFDNLGLPKEKGGGKPLLQRQSEEESQSRDREKRLPHSYGKREKKFWAGVICLPRGRSSRKEATGPVIQKAVSVCETCNIEAEKRKDTVLTMIGGKGKGVSSL